MEEEGKWFFGSGVEDGDELMTSNRNTKISEGKIVILCFFNFLNFGILD